MRIASVALVFAFIGALALTSHAAGAPGPAAYTAEQAAAGAKLYATNCSQCHGQSLEGLAGPALAGKPFIDKWNGQTADDLHYVMSTQMPQTAPGSLKPAEYLDLVAYVLQQNKYAAGADALTAAKLKSVKIAAQGG